MMTKRAPVPGRASCDRDTTAAATDIVSFLQPGDRTTARRSSAAAAPTVHRAGPPEMILSSGVRNYDPFPPPAASVMS